MFRYNLLLKSERNTRLLRMLIQRQPRMLLQNQQGCWSRNMWCLMRYLPEQHSQQQEDEDPNQQADGDDPSHHVTPGLLTVKGLEHQLQDDTETVNIYVKQTGHNIQQNPHNLTELNKHIRDSHFSVGPEIWFYRLYESVCHFLDVIMSVLSLQYIGHWLNQREMRFQVNKSIKHTSVRVFINPDDCRMSVRDRLFTTGHHLSIFEVCFRWNNTQNEYILSFFCIICVIWHTCLLTLKCGRSSPLKTIMYCHKNTARATVPSVDLAVNVAWKASRKSQSGERCQPR